MPVPPPSPAAASQTAFPRPRSPSAMEHGLVLSSPPEIAAAATGTMNTRSGRRGGLRSRLPAKTDRIKYWHGACQKLTRSPYQNLIRLAPKPYQKLIRFYPYRDPEDFGDLRSRAHAREEASEDLQEAGGGRQPFFHDSHPQSNFPRIHFSPPSVATLARSDSLPTHPLCCTDGARVIHWS